MKKFFSSIGWKSGLIFLAVIAWSVFQISNGHRLYAFLLILLSIFTICTRRTPYFVIALFVFVLLMTRTNSFAAWNDLKNSNMDFYEHPKETISRLFVPKTGREAYAQEAQNLLSFIDEADLSSYRFSQKIGDNIAETTRLVELAWPLRPDDSSPYVFCLLDELPAYSNCQVLNKGEEVALVYCN